MAKKKKNEALDILKQTGKKVSETKVLKPSGANNSTQSTHKVISNTPDNHKRSPKDSEAIKRNVRKNEIQIKYKNVYDLGQKVKNGTATDLEKAEFGARQRTFLGNISDETTMIGFQSLYDRYEKFAVGQDYDINKASAGIEIAKILEKDMQKRMEYAALFDEKNFENVDSLYGTIKSAKEHLTNAKSNMEKYGDENEYRIFRTYSNFSDIKDLEDTRYNLVKQKEEMQRVGGFEREIADIDKRLEYIDQYAYNDNILSQMDVDSYDELLNRIDYQFRQAKNNTEKYKSTAYIDKFYADAKKRGLSDEEARAEFQEAQKADDDYYKALSNQYNYVKEFKKEKSKEEEIKTKWEGMVSESDNFIPSDNPGYDPTFSAINYKQFLPTIAGDGERVSPEVVSFVTQKERKMYNQIRNKYGKEKADEYVSDIMPYLNKRWSLSKEKEAAEFASEHEILATIEKAITSPIRTIVGVGNNIYNLGATLLGEEIDPYDPRFSLHRRANAQTEAIENEIDSPVWKVIYGAGTQAAELFLNMAVAGGIGKIAGAMSGTANASQIASKVSNVSNQILLSSNSMLDTTLKYKESGESDLAAVGMGLLSGIIEAWTERNSLSRLMKSPNIYKELTGKEFAKAFAKTSGINFLEEGMEEVEANILNTFAAMVFDLRKNDSFLRALDEASANGESGAFWKALKSVAPEYIESFAVGGLAGLGFGAVNTISGRSTYSRARDSAEAYFGKNGYSEESLFGLMTTQADSKPDALAMAETVQKAARGELSGKEAEALSDNPVLSGVLTAYKKGYASRTNVETETLPDESVNVPEYKSESENSNVPKMSKEDAQQIISGTDIQSASSSEGREGAKITSNAYDTTNPTSFISKLIKEGYSEEKATNLIDGIYYFMYARGREGADLQETLGAVRAEIFDGVAKYENDLKAFYMAGAKDSANWMMGKTNARVVQNDVVKRLLKERKIDHKTIRAMNAIARKLGIDIIFADDVDGDGEFNTKTGVLRINANAKNRFFVTSVHESIHAMRTIDPESYNKITDMVYEVLGKNEETFSKAWGKVLSAYRKDATDENGNLNKGYINEELNAKVISELLTNEEFINELAKQDRNLFQKIRDLLVDLFDKIVVRYSERSNSSYEVYQAVKALKNEFNTIRNMYQSALESTESMQGETLESGLQEGVYNKKNSLTSNSSYDNINTENGGVLNNGFEQKSKGAKLGRVDNLGETERLSQVGKVGRSQSEKQDTSYTKRVHRSGVSAEVITSSGLTAEQMAIKMDNKVVGYSSEFFVNAKYNGVSQKEIFRTDNSIYYPDSDFVHSDIVINNGIAAFSEKRFQDLIEEFSVPIGGQLNGDYAKGYVAYISPSDFLSLTTTNEKQIISEAKNYGRLDLKELSENNQTLQLTIDFDSGKVVGHEGRHRMVLLRNEGIKNVAILIKPNSELNKYRTHKITDFNVLGQEFGKHVSPGVYTFGEIIPLSPNYREEVKDKFVFNEADVYYSKSKPDTAPDESIAPPKIRTTAQKTQAAFKLKEEVRKKLEQQAEKYGEMEKGEMPSRNVTIPKETDAGKVRTFQRTAIEADSVSDEAAQEIAESIANEELSSVYSVVSNKKVYEESKRLLEVRGFDSMLNEWEALLESGRKIEKQDISNAMLLVTEAGKNGDTETEVRILTQLAAEATAAGQSVQAFSLLKRLGPNAQTYAMNRAIERIKRNIDKKYGKQIEVPEELLTQYEEALKKEREAGNGNTVESDKYADQIMRHIGEQIPANWLDKWNTWRMLAMLGNPPTHLRNFLSNVLMWPVRFFKDMTAIGLESVFVEKSKHTKTLKGQFTRGDILKYAKEDAKKIESLLRGDSKYGGDLGGLGKYEDYRRIFKSKLFGWVNSASKKNSELLEKEDWWGLKLHYARAFTNYVVSQNIDVNNMTDKQLATARKIAVKEAQKSTFRDANVVAAWLNSAHDKSKVLGMGVDAVIPFKKTPMNVLKRGVEYSPVGLIKSLSWGIYQVRSGKINANEFIDGIAAGVTGTGLMLIGMLMKSAGLLRGAGDEDEYEGKLNKIIGAQNYSLVIGDHSYTIDWLSPSAMPMFVGCELMGLLNEENVSLGEFMKSFSRVLEPAFEMSMLQSLNDLISVASYEETTAAALGRIALDIPLSYVGQGVPTLVGRIAKTIDNTKRKTYIDKNSVIPDFLQSFVKQQMKKIPFLTFALEPYVNEKGQTEKNAQGNIFSRVLQNFVSPGYYKKVKSTAVDEEISRLYKTVDGASGIIPKTAKKTIKVNGKDYHLSAEQHNTYQEEVGKTYYEKAKEIITSDYYKGLSDSEKVKLLEKAMEYAGDKGKHKAVPEYKFDNGWLKTAMETTGGYKYLIETNKSAKFSEKDLESDTFDTYESQRDSMFRDILSNSELPTEDDVFMDKYYANLYQFTEDVALEANSDGQFTIDTKWINEIKGLSTEQQAEYIYGKTLRAMYDTDAEANTAINNNPNISSAIKLKLLNNVTVIPKSPEKSYKEHNLTKFNVSSDLWLDVYNEYNKIKETKQPNGKTLSKKDQIIMYINSKKISDKQKSALYRALGYKDTGKNLKVPWSYQFDLTNPTDYADALGFKVAYTNTANYNNDAARGQCVWYARGRAKEKLSANIPALGNANQMYASAKPEARLEITKNNIKPNTLVTYKVGTSPAGQKAGHVIYIEDVVGDTVYYTEGGYRNNGVVKKSTKDNIMKGLSGNNSTIGTYINGIIDVTKY